MAETPRALSDQIAEYPFLYNDDISSQITIIITTSAVKSNPSMYLVDTVMQSFGFGTGLSKCRKIIICDGLKVVEKEGSVRWKSGCATAEALTNYQVFIARLQELAAEGAGEWFNTTILPLPHRHGFSYGALEGIKLATTPYVMVVQHDRAFQQPVHFPSLLRDMKYHQYIWVEYVRELLEKNNIAFLKWDPSLPIGTPSIVKPGMSNDDCLPPKIPVRHPLRGDSSAEEITKHALESNPHFSIPAEEFTLNHLMAGFQAPFPIPYPQSSTQKPINQQYTEQTSTVTQKYRELPQPTTLQQACAPTSANIAREFSITTKVDLQFNNPLNLDLDKIQPPTDPTLFHTHFRHQKYPHPLPMHYVNFVTNQTQQYCSRNTGYSVHQQYGALPAFYSSQHTANKLQSEETDKLVNDRNSGKSVLNIYDQQKKAINAMLIADKCDNDSETSDTSDSDSDNTDNDTLEINDEHLIETPSEFSSDAELVELSNQHLVNCGVEPTHTKNYHFGSRFMPMNYWFDSTHVALTQWYRELYIPEQRGSYQFIRPGDFAEDRYIQFTCALLNYGLHMEKQLQKGITDFPHLWPHKRIMEYLNITPPNRPDTIAMQKANKEFISIPVDVKDTFSWTDDQRAMPFNYGAPPLTKCKELQQVALRIAICGKVQSFTDAHNIMLQQFGMWLFEHNPVSYDQCAEALHDINTHHRLCPKMRLSYKKSDKITLKYVENLHKRQMICGHWLKQLIIQIPDNVCKQNDEDNEEKNDKNKKIEDRTYAVWAVSGLDYLAGMTVKHLDGKGYLHYDQKVAKRNASLAMKEKKEPDQVHL